MGILLFIFAFMLESQARGPLCGKIFVLPTPVATIIPTPANDNKAPEPARLTSDFRNPDFKHTDTYTREIKSKRPVKDQCGTPLCHLHSWSADMENAHNIPISQAYLNAAFLFYKTELALRSARPDMQNTLGANPVDSMAAIRVLGIVPESIWKGSTEFHKEPTATRFIQSLDAIVANFRERVTRTQVTEQQNELYLEAFSEVSALFGTVLGTSMPSQFIYRGQEFTPQSFAQKYFPEVYQQVVKIDVADKPVAIVTATVANGALEIKSNMDTLIETAIELIDGGHAVQLGYQHRKQYIDTESGVMSLDAFRYPELARPISRKMRGDYRLWDNLHAVLLVGYERDVNTGRIIKWKIQNSWGPTVGDKGYFHMYDDYFRAYVFSIGYINNGHVPIPKYYSDVVVPFPTEVIDREEAPKQMELPF